MTIGGRELLLGNLSLMQQFGVNLNGLSERAQTLAQTGATPTYVAIGGQSAGLIAVADTLKPESRDAIEQLKALGLDVWMLTGDNMARAIAREVRVDHLLVHLERIRRHLGFVRCDQAPRSTSRRFSGVLLKRR